MKITDEQILTAFENTNYGENPNYKKIIVDTLIKLYLDFGTGKTSICVCQELNLLNSKMKPNKNGIMFIRENFDLIKLIN